MNASVKDILRKVESWPEEDQEELAEVARIIEARRTGVYRLSDEERAAVREGMAAAHRGDFAPDDEIEKFYQLHRTA
jgi:predicted transcriptional regulator